MNADGSGVEKLTDAPGADRWASFSPDGNEIAFTSDRSGNFDIYVLTLATKEVRQLTTSATDDKNPNWNPEDDSIAFISNRDGNNDIFSMGTDGSNQTNLTKNPADDYNFTWNADGSKLVFQSERGTPGHLGDGSGRAEPARAREPSVEGSRTGLAPGLDDTAARGVPHDTQNLSASVFAIEHSGHVQRPGSCTLRAPMNADGVPHANPRTSATSGSTAALPPPRSSAPTENDDSTRTRSSSDKSASEKPHSAPNRNAIRVGGSASGVR